MNKKSTLIILIAVAVIVVLGLWMHTASNKNTIPNTPLTVDQVNQTQNKNTTTRQLFSDSQMSKNAYLISTPTYDAATQKALSGFVVNKKILADGSTEIVLSSQNKEYTTQTYAIKPGQKLYFIESNLSDDNGGDKLLGDDSAVIVDESGYIVNN